ncbi:hypothetical protein G7Y89_g13921 [Cudoniella acicularis]|uniref:Uncharacterized protein n=1 Tax=Cudoniella acicularis TaxID=354080 RepID=A0A8H4VVZ2_9HELO|nr:hypothetical protein G7Y89_g13921 [Cudoniella acicularis]
MAAQEPEDSQLERSGIKRPWDEDRTLPAKGNTWHGTPLPPIDAVPHKSGQTPRRLDSGSILQSPYPRESIEPGPKRAKYEQNGYRPPHIEDTELSGSLHLRTNNTIYDTNHRSIGLAKSPSYPPKQRLEAWEARSGDRERHVELQNSNSLCRRCKQILTQHQDIDLLESCENCERDPELASLTQVAASVLTELAATLSPGISSEQRRLVSILSEYPASSLSEVSFRFVLIVIHGQSPKLHDLADGAFPSIAQFGLKRTLKWIVDRIQHVNTLADKLVQHLPSDTLQRLNRDVLEDGIQSREIHADMTKRCVVGNSDDGFRSRPDTLEPGYEARFYSIDRPLSNDKIPPLRSNYSHPSSHPSPNPRISMNPPSATNRQLPSPPGRSISSPTSVNFPSPSAPSFGNTSQPVNLPPPSALHQTNANSYLPPIGAPRASDTALQVHSAALQHEVSVQKIALSSLQGEHDKLLAAFSRSQTRASALEKKHNVSDAEIISLSEEKLRLQQQVIELEKDIEDLSRSRDECRQAAVQEGAQYVKIVRKASQLEEMAAQERKSWDILKAEMEKRIEGLRTGSRQGNDSERNSAASVPISTEGDAEKPIISLDKSHSLKQEAAGTVAAGAGDMRELTAYLTKTTNQQHIIIENLEGEVDRLRGRCAEMENALRAVREDSRSMAGYVDSLGLAGKAILERANKTLERGVEG